MNTSQKKWKCEVRVYTASDNTWRTVERAAARLDEMPVIVEKWKTKYERCKDVTDIYCKPVEPMADDA